MAVDEVKQKAARLSEVFLAGKPQDAVESLSLDEFAALYHTISDQVGVKQRIDIVLHDDRALVQFTSLSPGNQTVYVVSDRRLVREDFARIVNRPVFHGDVLNVSFGQRLKEESGNILVSLGAGLLVGLVLFLLANSVAADYQSYLIDPNSFPLVERVVGSLAQINEMSLTSATLFLSVFLVFTVAQNSRLQKDTRLFDSGLLHKFERDDRLIAMVALVSLLLSILNVGILGIPVVLPIASFQIAGVYTFVFNKLSIVVPALASLSVATLTFCFLSLLYYLKRTMLITSRDMSVKVLALARKSDAHSRSKAEEDCG